jgi:hypothetical protein
LRTLDLPVFLSDRGRDSVAAGERADVALDERHDRLAVDVTDHDDFDGRRRDETIEPRLGLVDVEGVVLRGGHRLQLDGGLRILDAGREASAERAGIAV